MSTTAKRMTSAALAAGLVAILAPPAAAAVVYLEESRFAFEFAHSDFRTQRRAEALYARLVSEARAHCAASARSVTARRFERACALEITGAVVVEIDDMRFSEIHAAALDG